MSFSGWDLKLVMGIRKPMGCSPSPLKEFMFYQKKTCGQINSLESNGRSPRVPRLRKGQKKRAGLAFWGSPVCLTCTPGPTEQLFSLTDLRNIKARGEGCKGRVKRAMHWWSEFLLLLLLLSRFSRVRLCATP